MYDFIVTTFWREAAAQKKIEHFCSVIVLSIFKRQYVCTFIFMYFGDVL